MKSKMADIHLKYAMYLEDEGDLWKKYFVVIYQKSNLDYTRGITPKRVTSSRGPIYAA